MANPHYLPFYTGDYRRATPHLTAEQHGAYLMILFTMFDAGGDLPNDQIVLRRVSTVEARRWPAVWKVLRPFFTEEGDRLYQKRTKSELLKCQIKSETLAANGARGNEAKRAKSLERTLANASPDASPDGNPNGHASQNQSQNQSVWEREKGAPPASGSRSRSGDEYVRKRVSEANQDVQGDPVPPPPAAPPAPPAPPRRPPTPARPAADPSLDGLPPFGPEAFAFLFGQEWPGQDHPKFNEKVADAEAAFFKHINAENYPAFLHAFNAQLASFATDTSPTRRKDLGTFRTFCEERWTKYKDPAPPPIAASAPAEGPVLAWAPPIEMEEV